MKKTFQALLASLALLLPIQVAAAQNASFGLTPNSTATQSISVTNSSSTITLPNTIGSTVVIFNTGTTTAYVTPTTTATTTGFPIPGGMAVAFNFPPGGKVSAITGGTDTTTLLVGKGSGSTAISGGGSGGGAGGSVTQGTVPWQVSGNGTANSNTNPVYIDATSGGQLLAQLATATPAGTNIIGKVGIDSTTNTVSGTGASGAALSGNPFRVGLSDGTNSQNWLAAIILGDGVNGNNTGAVASWLWNGATYDRQRGDLTNGAFVNVKTSVLPTGAALSANQGLPYPPGAVPLTASATGTTAATTATLGGAVGKTTYICSLSVRANASANTNVTDTVTGVITGTLSRALWVPANTAGLGVDEQIYSPCVPASGTNQAIAVVSGAPGTGGVVSVNATGYQL